MEMLLCIMHPSSIDYARVFQNGTDERGITKIESLSPHCISEAVVHVSLDTNDRSSSSFARWQSNMPPLLLRSSTPDLSPRVLAPPLLRVMVITRRSSRACAPPWVGGGAERVRRRRRWARRSRPGTVAAELGAERGTSVASSTSAPRRSPPSGTDDGKVWRGWRLASEMRQGWLVTSEVWQDCGRIGEGAVEKEMSGTNSFW
jgi:hypothetical protein